MLLRLKLLIKDISIDVGRNCHRVVLLHSAWRVLRIEIAVCIISFEECLAASSVSAVLSEILLLHSFKYIYYNI
jgi:hypothetical protein